VLRVLRSLMREGRLVRLGYGVYRRAITSNLSAEAILYRSNGFIGAARQALNKLGVKWEPTEAERAYNEGRSTQVPVHAVLRVRGRFSGQLPSTPSRRRYRALFERQPFGQSCPAGWVLRQA
jgi:hypothetical protein